MPLFSIPFFFCTIFTSCTITFLTSYFPSKSSPLCFPGVLSLSFILPSNFLSASVIWLNILLFLILHKAVWGCGPPPEHGCIPVLLISSKDPRLQLLCGHEWLATDSIWCYGILCWHKGSWRLSVCVFPVVIGLEILMNCCEPETRGKMLGRFSVSCKLLLVVNCF